MKTFVLILLFCHTSVSVKHSLQFFITVSSGVKNFPDFVAMALVNGFKIGYCDSNGNVEKIKQIWIQKLLHDEPEQWEWYTGLCLDSLPRIFKAEVFMLKQQFNQSGDVHILQRLNGCEWDDETGEISGFWQFGYNGEDFISLDLNTQTWITPKKEALVTKMKWDADKLTIRSNENYLKLFFPELLQKYVNYGGGYLLRTVPPSVSLLRQSPSSPVSCHATGFYPDRAQMFWRKDGEEIHEDVDQGEILPNQDGTFQMRVDLNISADEDWSRYECVFQMSGTEEKSVTKLDEALIRTNRSKVPVAAVVGLLVLVVGITGFLMWKKKNNGFRPANTTDASDQKQEAASD